MRAPERWRLGRSEPALAQMDRESAPAYTATNGSEVKSFASVFTPDGYLFSSRMGAYEVSMSLMQEATAHQLLAAANQELTEESESAVQEATVPAETTLPTKDTSDSEASLPSEETTPDPGTEVQEATAPPEASADEGTQPETGASGLPESRDSQSRPASRRSVRSPKSMSSWRPCTPHF